MEQELRQLSETLQGELKIDPLSKIIYATDGSIYREIPLGAAFPKDDLDIRKLVDFAGKNNISLIPRTAGTSLAGQCVGNGLVVDVSRYMNKILEINAEEQWVRLQPGVVRDELNKVLHPYGLFFGPITSTASRAMIGGMVGNNSSGTTSIKYGVTRDHVLELKTVLSDGTVATFSQVSKDDFYLKTQGHNLESRLYQQIYEELRTPSVQRQIHEHFPKPGIHRRNTGYAVDELLKSDIFEQGRQSFNFCKLLCGSEGTLAITTEIKLHVDKLPPAYEVMVCAHFSTLQEALSATLRVMKHQPYGCELMDKFILDCTKENREQQKNRFFIEGDPGAILMIELRGEEQKLALREAEMVINDLQTAGLGYAFPIVEPPLTKRVLALRAAGFGVLSNVKGDKKPLEFVEDTAVDLPDLPAYIEEFSQIMSDFGQEAVYYAHAGAGELHIRPKVNLKSTQGLREMREVALASALLVKKYKGSLSGEHGDGRVRGEFIPVVLGQENYELFRRIKHTWDPNNIFNPGKIVNTPPIDQSLRYLQDTSPPAIETVFDFSSTGGILKLAEKCSGSGDCRKLAHVSGGVMCPSYMATRNEKDTTRARANALREFLTRTEPGKNKFAHKELYEVMDLCLSCKGCAGECPSNVDVATMKAEFLYQYQRKNGVPFRSWAFGNIGRINALAINVSGISNFFLNAPVTGNWIKNILGISSKRSLPSLYKISLANWFLAHVATLPVKEPVKGEVFFFFDEFTNYNDVEVGMRAIQLLTKLGYKVDSADHGHSGRAQLSKGLLMDAQKLASKNVKALAGKVSDKKPIIGLEPSAILTFRDEYPRLVEPEWRERAVQLGKNALMLEEFLVQEMAKGNIGKEQFTSSPAKVLVHGHCHQKALANVGDTAAVLCLPEHYDVEILSTGCCGMAGSFGYEKEHYEVSMQIGELALFPALRQSVEDVLIAAPGTSCRHQIYDGVQKKAHHPAEILWKALKE